MALFLTFVVQEAGFAQEKSLMMAILGDSITAGSLADAPIPAGSSPEERLRDWARQGLDSQFLYTNKDQLSWASGSKVGSHFLRLQEWLKAHGETRALKALNVAHPGDTTYDLEGQAQSVAEAMRSGEYDAAIYVTILIGSNDACSTRGPIGTPLDEMRENILRAVEVLAKIPQAEPLRILLVGIPRVPDLGTPAFRQAKTVLGLSCETARNHILHFCDPLLLWNTPEEYGEKMQIVEDKNRLLRNLARELSAARPGIQVVYSNRLYNLAIPLELLAIDCFHPNETAQREISRQLWMDQPWFN